MNTLRASAGVVWLWLVVAASSAQGREAFVRVADGPLYYSPQVAPRDVTRDAQGQADEALAAVVESVTAAGGRLDTIARLNAYVRSDEDRQAVERAVAARFANSPVTLVTVATALPVDGARVVFDAVAGVAENVEQVRVLPAGGAILPAGAKVFLAGLVERGDGMVAGVGRTMDGLGAMLRHLGLGWGDVVQVKAFLQPYAERTVAEREIAARFPGNALPPVVWVEWVQNQPAEIELVAGGRALTVQPAEALSFPDFPGRTRSARYSHAAVVSAGTPLIFLDGLTPRAGLSPREQWKDVFGRLGHVLFEAGSGFRHLVKATYYTSDPEARRLLNEIRPVYYDPARPPSASAIGVRDTGHAGAQVHVDFIAVPQ